MALLILPLKFCLKQIAITLFSVRFYHFRAPFNFQLEERISVVYYYSYANQGCEIMLRQHFYV